jgi:hypothetical protein
MEIERKMTTPAVSVGEFGFFGDKKMNAQKNPTSLEQKLESFLDRACIAEAGGNLREANRLFRMALLCEGRLRPDVVNYKQYADEAGPVYSEADL